MKTKKELKKEIERRENLPKKSKEAFETTIFYNDLKLKELKAELKGYQEGLNSLQNKSRKLCFWKRGEEMKVEEWFNIGIIYLAILFGTAIASLIPYDLEGWLMLSAFLMIVWLIEIGLIEKEVKGNENIN